MSNLKEILDNAAWNLPQSKWQEWAKLVLAERDEYHDQYHLCEAKLLSHNSIIKQGQVAYKELQAKVKQLKENQLAPSQRAYLIRFLKLRLMSKPNQAIEKILEVLEK